MLTGTGTRRALEPVAYLAAAILLHALLFLIPAEFAKPPDAGMTRGIRIRVIGDAPAASAARTFPPSVSSPRETVPSVPPTAMAEKPYSSLGGEMAGQKLAGAAGPDGATATSGDRGASDRTIQGNGDVTAQSEFGSYLEKLRSEKVQGWARDTAGRTKQGWKGSGKTGAGWGTGTGPGDGSGAGGKGTGKGGGSGYLDPRVRMVVTSYPPTGIERGYTNVPYPDLKIKQHQVTSGWWNVYIQIVTDRDGRIIKRKVLRPETDGPVEKLFVAQVQKEIDRWRFEPAEAEILVDVRFHVE